MKKHKRMKRGDINEILNKLRTSPNPYYLKRKFERNNSYKSIRETLYRERRPNYKKKVNMLDYVLNNEKFWRLNRIEEDESAGKSRLGSKPILPKVIGCSSIKKSSEFLGLSNTQRRKNSNLRLDRNWTKVQELIKENRKEVNGLGSIDMKEILENDTNGVKRMISLSPKGLFNRCKRKKINIFYNYKTQPRSNKIPKKNSRRNFYSMVSEEGSKPGNRKPNRIQV